MIPWAPEIEQWREYAALESRDIPVDLMLAIIRAESNGAPGIKSSTPSGCAELPRDDGTTQKICQDLGLTQINPQTVAFYNQHRPAGEPVATVDDMTGKDERGARQQIRVGAWYYSWIVKRLNIYDKVAFQAPTPGRADANQTKFALAAYSAGFKALTDKLDPIKAADSPLNFDSFAVANSAWRGTVSALRKWSFYTTRGPTKPSLATTASPSWLPVVLALGAGWIIKHYASKSSDNAKPFKPIFENPLGDFDTDLHEETDDDDEVDDEAGNDTDQT